MRVFVTGATGFVGSHVTEALRARGHEVHALVLAGDPFGARLGEGVVRIEGDLLAPETYAPALQALRPDACVHLGWVADPRTYLSARVNVNLLAASARLASQLVDLGCARIVAAGTCFEYDTSLGWLTESSALRPRHLYSTCKRALHDLMVHLVAGTKTTLAWTRLFWLYGPHEQPGRLVPAVIDALLAGEEARVSAGDRIRDFMHVVDAAAAIVHVLEDTSFEGPINVATGRPVAVREVVETIARNIPGGTRRVAWGAVKPRPDDPPFVCADVRRLAATGFLPRFDLATGIVDTIQRREAGRARG